MSRSSYERKLENLVLSLVFALVIMSVIIMYQEYAQYAILAEPVPCECRMDGTVDLRIEQKVGHDKGD